MTIPGAQVLWRDLAILPRSRWLSITRAVYLLVLLTFFTIPAMSIPVEYLGPIAFRTIAVIEGLIILAFGALLTAPIICEERDLGTDALLRTAGVSSAAWILGKLGPRFLEVAYLALAGVPFLAAIRILGGVTGAELIRLAVTLAGMLVWAAALGTVFSALCRPRSPASSGSSSPS